MCQAYDEFREARESVAAALQARTQTGPDLALTAAYYHADNRYAASRAAMLHCPECAAKYHDDRAKSGA